MCKVHRTVVDRNVPVAQPAEHFGLGQTGDASRLPERDPLIDKHTDCQMHPSFALIEGDVAQRFVWNCDLHNDNLGEPSCRANPESIRTASTLPTMPTTEMLARIGNVLADVGQKIQWIEYLKIAFRPGHQVLARGFGEAPQPIVPRFVDDFALFGHLDLSACGHAQADHSRLAERAAQEVLDQPLEALGVFRLHADALIHAEAGVLPTADVGDDLPVIFPSASRSLKISCSHNFRHGSVASVGCGRRVDVGQKHAFRNQRVYARMPMDQVAEPLNGPDHARHSIGLVTRCGIDFTHHLPGRPAQLPQTAAGQTESKSAAAWE